MTKAINSFGRRIVPRDESSVANSKKTLRLIRSLCKLGLAPVIGRPADWSQLSEDE